MHEQIKSGIIIGVFLIILAWVIALVGFGILKGLIFLLIVFITASAAIYLYERPTKKSDV